MKNLIKSLLMTAIIGANCNLNQVPEIPKIGGTIIKEQFIRGLSSDTYYMIVQGDDGHTRMYVLHGSLSEFDFKYDVGSRINLPIQKKYNQLLIRTSDKDILDKINKIELIK